MDNKSKENEFNSTTVGELIKIEEKILKGEILSDSEKEIHLHFKPELDKMKEISDATKIRTNEFNEMFAKIENKFKEHIELLKDEQKNFINTGYFPSENMCHEDLKLEGKLYFQKNYKLIKQIIFDFFKNEKQEKMLIEAFKLYENNYLYGAIILLLPIIDGMFYDDKNFNVFLTKSKNREKFLSEHFYFIPNVLNKISETDIAKSCSPNANLLNRHLILHGWKCDYGENDENFFKILSFLLFLIEYKESRL